MRVASIQVKANDLKDYKEAWVDLEKLVVEAAKTHTLILVPECAFPAYFLHKDEGDLPFILSQGETYLNRMKEIAKQERVYIAYGYVEQLGESLYNTALLIDRNGNELVKKRKSFLWHFDSQWFVEGDDVAVCDTDFGRVALVVCADARMPEIVRLAKLEGAELIIDLANLTATGPDISALQNAQSAYMLSVRALENQVWLAVSDKWGVESNSITYAGRSGVFAPDGKCLYQASSDKNEIASVEIPVDDNGKIIKISSNDPVTRRPELYLPLVEETEKLPISTIIKQPVIPDEVTPYITVASGEFVTLEEYVKMVRRLVNHGGQIVCMPPTKLPIQDHTEEIGQLLPENVVVVATVENELEGMTSYLLTSEGPQANYHTLHTKDCPVDTNQPPIFDTKWGKIGIIHDRENLLPEWSRTLMLLGADCMVWPNKLPGNIASNIGRTRAAESRIFVVSAQVSTENNGVSQVIDPNGAVIASTLQSEKIHACGTLTPFTLSRIKELVPGTNVVNNRRPKYYGGLTNEKD